MNSGQLNFDAWIEGNEKAISEDAKRGFALFNGKALCSACHEGWNFTNDGFQDIGLPSKDIGRGEFVPGVVVPGVVVPGVVVVAPATFVKTSFSTRAMAPSFA